MNGLGRCGCGRTTDYFGIARAVFGGQCETVTPEFGTPQAIPPTKCQDHYLQEVVITYTELGPGDPTHMRKTTATYNWNKWTADADAGSSVDEILDIVIPLPPTEVHHNNPYTYAEFIADFEALYASITFAELDAYALADPSFTNLFKTYDSGGNIVTTLGASAVENGIPWYNRVQEGWQWEYASWLIDWMVGGKVVKYFTGTDYRIYTTITNPCTGISTTTYVEYSGVVGSMLSFTAEQYETISVVYPPYPP